MIKLRTGWMGGLALLAVLLVGGAGCEKKTDADKAKTEAAAAGSNAAAAAGSAAPVVTAADASTAAAVGSGSAAPVVAGGAESPVIAELHALRDTACACKDKACAEGVQKSFEGFIQKHMNTKPGPGDEKLAEGYATEMMECLMKALGSGVPGADPDPSIAAPPAAE